MFGDCKIPCETTQVTQNTGPNVPDIRNLGCGGTPQVNGYVTNTKNECNLTATGKGTKHTLSLIPNS